MQPGPRAPGSLQPNPALQHPSPPLPHPTLPRATAPHFVSSLAFVLAWAWADGLDGSGGGEEEEEGQEVPSSPVDPAVTGHPISPDMPPPATTALVARVAAWGIVRLLCSGRGAPATTISTAQMLLQALMASAASASASTEHVPLVATGPASASGLVLGGRGRLPFPPALSDASIALAAVNAAGNTVPAAHARVLYHLQLLACVDQAASTQPVALATQEGLGSLLALGIRWGALQPAPPSDPSDALPLHLLTVRVRLLGNVLRHVLCAGNMSSTLAARAAADAAASLRAGGSQSLWASEGCGAPNLTTALLLMVGAVTANVGVTVEEGAVRVTPKGGASHLSTAFASELVAILRTLMTHRASHLGSEALQSVVQALANGDRATGSLAALGTGAGSGPMTGVDTVTSALALCGALAVLGGHTEVVRMGGVVHVVAGAGDVLGDKCMVVGVECPMSQAHPTVDATARAFEGVEVCGRQQSAPASVSGHCLLLCVRVGSVSICPSVPGLCGGNRGCLCMCVVEPVRPPLAVCVGGGRGVPVASEPFE